MEEGEMTAYPDPGPRPCARCDDDYTPIGRLDRGVCSDCWSAIHGTREHLTFDEKVFVACVLAEFTEKVVTGTTGRLTHHYDAVGWASWGSVEKAMVA